MSRWRRCRKKEIPRLTEELNQQGWGHAAFLNRLREAREYPDDASLSNDLILRYPLKEGKSHYFLISPGGTLLPALEMTQWNSDHGRQLSRLLSRRFTKFHSLMGLASYEGAMESHLPPPAVKKSFHLMVLNHPLEKPQSPLENLTLMEGSCDGADLFFPLEKGYQQDEVIVNPDRVNWPALALSYRQKLERQHYLWALIDGEPAAQGGTNAQGPLWDQLGGIYTAPAWRGYGIATYLVSSLAYHRQQAGKKVCLFVDKENKPAQRVYQKIGFTPITDFSLIYF